MAVSSHVTSLADKHAKLEALILQEEQRPSPDMLQMRHWKKEKLRLKEEMSRFTQH